MSCGPLMPSTEVDQFLHQQFDVLRIVMQNIDAIRRVADHLTPVEDLQDFKDQIEALYPHLAALSEAAYLMLNASEAGIILLTAEDAAAQREALGLGSAALLDADELAAASEFELLQATVTNIQALLAVLQSSVTGSVSQEDFVELSGRVAALETSTQYIDLINQLIADLEAGDYFGGLQAQITALQEALAILQGQVAGWDGQIGLLNGLIADINVSLGNTVTALATLTTTVTLLTSDQEALAAFSIELNTRLSTAEGTIVGQAGALSSLTSRVTATEDGLTSQSSAITSLQVGLTDANSGLSAQSLALQALQATVVLQGTQLLSTSTLATQLESRISDAETGMEGLALAQEELTTRVEASEAGLIVNSEHITQLTSSLTSVGNLFPNAGFEAGIRGWIIFSRGLGWLSAQLQHNMDAALLPPGVGSMGTTVLGHPFGELGARTEDSFPVEARSRYLISAYLAAQNCRVRFLCRLYDAAGQPVRDEIIGDTTAGPATNLDGCTRVHQNILIPEGVSSIAFQFWVSDVSAAAPKAWLFRPMMEQAVEGQINPSPWTHGLGGLEQSIATAYEELSTRVDSSEEELLVQSQKIVQLEANSTINSTTYIQPNEPVGGTYRVGDVWYDTDAGYETYRLIGGAWVRRSSDPLAISLLHLQQTNNRAMALEEEAVAYAQQDVQDFQVLQAMAANGVLSVSEKILLSPIYDRAVNDFEAIEADAVDAGLTAELAAYVAKLAALTAYMDTLTTPVVWDNLTDVTDLT